MMTTETTDTITTTDAGSQSAAATSATSTQSPGFLDSLPSDLRVAPSLQNFKDTASLAKSYVEAQSMIGKSVRLPPENASPEELASFYDKIGRPKTPDDYRLEAEQSPLLDPAQIKNFKQMAHQLGLTNSQVDALVKFEATRTSELTKAHETAQIEAQVKAEEAKNKCNETLKEAWGVDYSNRLAAAKELTAHYGNKYPDAVKELVEGSAGNNPVVLMMLSELGKAYKESGIITGNRSLSFGKTPDEARAEIKAIQSDLTHPYHKGDRAAVERVSQLYQASYPESN